MNWSNRSRKISFTKCWKVAGALQSPKGITRLPKCPYRSQRCTRPSGLRFAMRPGPSVTSRSHDRDVTEGPGSTASLEPDRRLQRRGDRDVRGPLLMHPMILFALAAAAWHWLLQVLTLDPTLHRKPSHNAILSKAATHCGESYAAPVTPDSILENLSYNPDDEETASNASSLLVDSSHRSPQCLAVGDKHWKATRYKVKENIDYQLCHGDASSDERMNCTEDEANSLASSPISQSPVPAAEKNMPCPSGIYSMEHPVVLSNVRRSLREKHARHLSDLKDYYESEIINLKQQLLANNKSTSTEDLMKINSLTERCAQLEGALTEASKRIHVLENQKRELESQVAEWREQCHTTNGTSKDLQEKIEEMRSRSKEKENAISRLQYKLKEAEELLQKTIRQSDDKEARIKQEHKMFQDLLLEYESLGKEHERVKDTLSITENTLCNAHSEVNELRRAVLKLETQIKQLEHGNMVALHHRGEGQLWSPRPNNEILHPSTNSYDVDVAARKCLPSEAEGAATTQPLDNKAKEMERKQDIMYEQNRYPGAGGARRQSGAPIRFVLAASAIHHVCSALQKRLKHRDATRIAYDEAKANWAVYQARNTLFNLIAQNLNQRGLTEICYKNFLYRDVLNWFTWFRELKS
ncbi:unnamed protein product [Ranitomeya imitator]|uniref:Uncharacterized protein n=1 Tax=Ranitomeya imitator TaxID=111125 RepID=A0ABN9LL19_9NEOB|nr:unnamed protein product [Ranitomeya imitator]